MKVVTVHRGARDGYQVARALEESNLLDSLVTDVFWPSDQPWARQLEKWAPRRAAALLGCRQGIPLPSRSVESRWLSGVGSLLAHKARHLPFRWQSAAIRWCDRDLGRRAGQIASQRNAALLSYSYYAHSAFSHFSAEQPRILFQLHPHPASIRSLLLRERELHPDCASSLDKEWELVLPEADYRQLVEEVQMAQHWIVASQFTRQTLVEHGIASDAIQVIPYGIDLSSFQAKTYPAAAARKPLQLLFVGTLGQRKGIKYLLEAIRLLAPGSVEVTFCGRPVDDLSLLKNYPYAVSIFPNISPAGLHAAYQAADVFVFPSLAEGFGHVLLEAMASGLPIISTTHTAAPDLIRQGQEGFVVNPGSAAELAGAIEQFLRDPGAAARMGFAARQRAEFFTWQRFRRQVASFVSQVVDPQVPVAAGQSCSLA